MFGRRIIRCFSVICVPGVIVRQRRLINTRVDAVFLMQYIIGCHHNTVCAHRKNQRKQKDLKEVVQTYHPI